MNNDAVCICTYYDDLTRKLHPHCPMHNQLEINEHAVSDQELFYLPVDKIKERHGSKTFYNLLDEMAETHSKKAHDYASNEDPYGNYHFAGLLSKLFNNTDDSGFIGRLAEKIYRLANIENNNKIVLNESIEDTERDIATIVTLWVADRRDRRARKNGMRGS